MIVILIICFVNFTNAQNSELSQPAISIRTIQNSEKKDSKPKSNLPVVDDAWVLKSVDDDYNQKMESIRQEYENKKQIVERGLQERNQARNLSQNKLHKLHSIATRIMKYENKNEIPKLYNILNDLTKLLEKWEEKKELGWHVGQDPEKAREVYILIGETTALARLIIGDVHRVLGQYRQAKDMYRYIVVNYVGYAYQSYVRKAEFALQDVAKIENKKSLK